MAPTLAMRTGSKIQPKCATGRAPCPQPLQELETASSVTRSTSSRSLRHAPAEHPSKAPSIPTLHPLFPSPRKATIPSNAPTILRQLSSSLRLCVMSFLPPRHCAFARARKILECLVLSHPRERSRRDEDERKAGHGVKRTRQPRKSIHRKVRDRHPKCGTPPNNWNLEGLVESNGTFRFHQSMNRVRLDCGTRKRIPR